MAQPGQQVQQRRFAATGRSNHSPGFFGSGMPAKAVKEQSLVWIGKAQIANVNHGNQLFLESGESTESPVS
jgi:hypothetical protein